MYNLIIILIIAFTSLALAQPPETEPRKLIERIKIWTIIDELDLNEDQIAKFLPKFKENQKNEHEFFEKRMQKISQLNDLLRNPKTTDDKLKTKVEEIEQLQAEFKKKQEASLKEMHSILTIRQRAKLLVFLEQFEKKLRRIIEEIRKRPGPPPQGKMEHE